MAALLPTRCYIQAYTRYVIPFPADLSTLNWIDAGNTFKHSARTHDGLPFRIQGANFSYMYIVQRLTKIENFYVSFFQEKKPRMQIVKRRILKNHQNQYKKNKIKKG